MKRKRFINNLKAVVHKIKLHEIREIAPLLPEIDFTKIKKRGRNYYFMSCPFHNEKTPSFSYNPNGNFFHCFGCHQGGDIINIYSALRNKGFYPSVIRLAKFFKVKLEWVNVKL